jgi:hypothetical protein
LTAGAQSQNRKDTMANFQALVIETQLPLDGVAGRLRWSLTIASGERRDLFQFSNIQ